MWWAYTRGGAYIRGGLYSRRFTVLYAHDNVIVLIIRDPVTVHYLYPYL